MMTPFAADRPAPPLPPRRKAARAIAIAEHASLPSDRMIAGTAVAAALLSLALWAAVTVLLLPTF